jgi:hypothetical protein
MEVILLLIAAILVVVAWRIFGSRASGYADTVAPGVANLAVGSAVNCNASDPAGRPTTGGPGDGGTVVYRYTGSNTLSMYPNSNIALTWDQNYANPTTINCAGLKAGPDMVAKLNQGQSFTCNSNDPTQPPGKTTYRYEQGTTMRAFPDPATASTWDPNAATAPSTDCLGLKNAGTLGPVTPAMSLIAGQSVNCMAGDPSGESNYGYSNGGGKTVYRYTGSNTINSYVNPIIAASWNPSWQKSTVTNCTTMSRGPDMALGTWGAH